MRKIERLGLQCPKFDPGNRNGMPDREILLRGGRVLWVETKTLDGKLSELQKLRHIELAKLGHWAVVAWTPEQVDALVDMVAEGCTELWPTRQDLV